jgi:hypothetical protein
MARTVDDGHVGIGRRGGWRGHDPQVGVVQLRGGLHFRHSTRVSVRMVRYQAAPLVVIVFVRDLHGIEWGRRDRRGADGAVARDRARAAETRVRSHVVGGRNRVEIPLRLGRYASLYRRPCADSWERKITGVRVEDIHSD